MLTVKIDLDVYRIITCSCHMKTSNKGIIHSRDSFYQKKLHYKAVTALPKLQIHQKKIYL